MSAAALVTTAMLAATIGDPPLDGLTPAQIEGLHERLSERSSFVESVEARREPQTLGRFFGQAEYRLLRGNPTLGYWDLGTFHWSGRRIAWRGISARSPEAARIAVGAWTAAFDYAVRRRGLISDPRAPVKLEGACVVAVVDPTDDQPVPGVLLEVRIVSPTGTLRYRIAVGKPTIEDAIGSSLDFLIGFAASVR